ncbi:MAG: hypothetical protein N7Q72_00305 [Spiroplasma sp. Tabriz.8]|nr:hypothetical protein [Spiroplasma sp. Tabriz.8]
MELNAQNTILIYIYIYIYIIEFVGIWFGRCKLCYNTNVSYIIWVLQYY